MLNGGKSPRRKALPRFPRLCSLYPLINFGNVQLWALAHYEGSYDRQSVQSELEGSFDSNRPMVIASHQTTPSRGSIVLRTNGAPTIRGGFNSQGSDDQGNTW
jgi:hypothetical protein